MTTKNKALAPDSVLIIQPCIVDVLGKSTAIFLQQVHYWLTSKNDLGQNINGTRWIYNSLEQWQQNIGILSVSTIKRSIQKLRELNILIVDHFGYKKSDRTNWYTINYNQLSNLIGSLNQSDYLPNKNKIVNQHHQKYNKINSNNQFKMNQSSAQNELMYNMDTKITTNTHKSDNFYVDQHSIKVEKNKQVNPVKKNYLAQQLLDIWNEEIGNKIQKSEMTKERARYLIAAFKTKFNTSIDQWRVFCQKIALNDFLMGKVKSSFKISIDWAIKFSTIQKFFEGSFGLKLTHSAPEQSHIPSRQSVVTDILQFSQTEWERWLRHQIMTILGHEIYHLWFRKINFSKNEGDITIIVPSKFMADYIQGNFLQQIVKMVNQPISVSVESFLKAA